MKMPFPAEPVTSRCGKRFQATVALFALVALDDVVSHAFGVRTPLDWIWTAFLVHLLA